MILEEIVSRNKGIRLSINNDNEEIGHVYLYIMYNDLHKRPFGFVEDLFVEENFRGSSNGTKLLKALITRAKEENCYKLIANSRIERKSVHKLYIKNLFKKHGYEFRMNL